MRIAISIGEVLKNGLQLIMTNFVVRFNPIHLDGSPCNLLDALMQCGAHLLAVPPDARAVCLPPRTFFHGKVGRRGSLHPSFAFFGEIVL